MARQPCSFWRLSPILEGEGREARKSGKSNQTSFAVLTVLNWESQLGFRARPRKSAQISDVELQIKDWQHC